MIVIIGAGLAGLSCAMQLKKKKVNYIVLEKANSPGGYCKSYLSKGYRFDLAGHFLHFRSLKVKTLAFEILRGRITERKRKSSILMQGARVPFPFQAHTGALSIETNLECLVGYIRSLQKEKPKKAGNFKEWILYNFGEGMARHFFFPYNEKFWKINLDKILVDWTDWSIPRPTVEEVVRGAFNLKNEGLGYNPIYFYPTKGGINLLPLSLSNKVENIRYNSEVTEINSIEKLVQLRNGQKLHYEALVSTIPLPHLVQITKGLDNSLKRNAKRLSWVIVDCVQVGIDSKRIFYDDWSYIPEPKYPFCRVGKYPGSGKGTRLYVEFTRSCTSRAPHEKQLISSAIKGLKKLKIITSEDIVDEAHMITLDPAYVVYNKWRKDVMPKITSALKRLEIFSIGRYGAWEYSSMEDAILQGINTAESLSCGWRK